MTTNEKRIKLAEACGWTQIKPETAAGNPYGVLPPLRGWLELPDYFNDLNACHQMEKKLSDNQWVTYMDNLCVVNGRQCGLPKNTCRRAVIHASADLRAEAFGKTLNLW